MLVVEKIGETWKELVLAVLILITIYRRRLSSNDAYRDSTNARDKEEVQQKGQIKPNEIFKSLANIIRKKAGQQSRPSTPRNDSSFSLHNLPVDIIINLVGYLNTSEIVKLMAVSKRMKFDLQSDTIWEQLWLQTYGSMWKTKTMKKLREDKGIFWDPLNNCGHPQQGWYTFYITFEACWADWLLAGYCTNERCVVVLNSSIYDLTSFVHEHPGSSETLTEMAGCDATESFIDIGHSTFAESLLPNFCIWDNEETDPFMYHNATCLSPKERNVISGLERRREVPNTRLMCQMGLSNRKYQNTQDSDYHYQNIQNLASTYGATEIRRSPTLFTTSIAITPINNLQKTMKEQQKAIVSYAENIEMGRKNRNHIGDMSDSYKLVPLLDGYYCNDCGDKRGFISPSTLGVTADVNIQGPLPINPTATDPFPTPDATSNLSLQPPPLPSPTSSPASSPSLSLCRHEGQCKVCFDPLAMEWVVWWSCCGYAQTLKQSPVTTDAETDVDIATGQGRGRGSGRGR